MKRSFSMIIALTLMLSVASCSSSTSGSTKTTDNIQTTEESKTVEPARLINKMTAGEFYLKILTTPRDITVTTLHLKD